MLVLFETPAGYALFKINDEGVLQKQESVLAHFANAEAAQKTYAGAPFCVLRKRIITP